MVELHAIDASRGVARRYRIELTRDMFGVLIVEVHWGRIATKGQRKCRSFEAEAQATRYIAAALRRRATAITRIGVAYREVYP